ncbi:hypothetical protein F7Q93_09360 [Brucella pituitosa]|uniref:Uncharacterized protein n=1 Tax=Brucella pituitosa TaxID=571256 RepID=A0A643F0S8_9HYPH|nr:hypothetical protein F7Q93_09360 [Brucella pituitosa]
MEALYLVRNNLPLFHACKIGRYGLNYLNRLDDFDRIHLQMWTCIHHPSALERIPESVKRFSDKMRVKTNV